MRKKNFKLVTPEKPSGMKKSFVQSIAMHAALFAVMIILMLGGGGKGKENGGGNGNPIDVEILAKPENSNADDIAQVEKDGLEKRAPHVKDDCPSFFGGIGVEYQNYGNGEGLISRVFPGYPAERAGLVPGDVLLNNDDILGEIGTKVTISYRRGSTGDSEMVEVYRDKICTEKPKTPSEK